MSLLEELHVGNRGNSSSSSDAANEDLEGLK